jgi:DNA primase
VGNNGQMSTIADEELRRVVVTYYRGVGSTLLKHLRGRRVEGSGRDEAIDGVEGRQAVRLHIADLEDLDEAVRSGIMSFRLPGLTGAGLVSLRIRPGVGSGIDTVATAALALATSMSLDGIAATAMTDGAGGLYLVGFPVGPTQPSATAARYAEALAGLAPEIATTDSVDSDGRALVQPLPVAGGRAVPAPYSLVSSAVGLGVAAPLTMDEVAAATAGMSLEIEPADLLPRLSSYGDLAAALGEATDPSA